MRPSRRQNDDFCVLRASQDLTRSTGGFSVISVLSLFSIRRGYWQEDKSPLGGKKVLPSVLSQRFVEEVSPDVSGRKNVAHGGSRGSASLPHPRPLSRSGGRGVPKAGRGLSTPGLAPWATILRP